MDWNIPPFQQTSSFNESKGQNDESRDSDLKFTPGESSSNAKNTRARRHSTCSYVPRHAMAPAISISEASPIDEEGAQDVTSTANSGFVGLHRRRKISLPSQRLLKPEQFLEGGRVELRKREVNLEAHMPVFTKEPAGAVKKRSTTIPLTKTEANGWMFEGVGSKMAVNQGGRQRRVSLPVLMVDKPDAPVFPNCNSASSGELNNNFLSPSSPRPIPRVNSGPLIGKKSETRQWAQRF